MSDFKSNTPNVVVVGSGCAGLDVYHRLAQRLDSITPSSPAPFTLTLVTSRPYFVHLPAAIRLNVTSEGSLETRAIIQLSGLDQFTKEGRSLVVGTVASIVEQEEKGQSGYVVLESGEKVPYAILVLATGMSWKGSAWSYEGQYEETLRSVNEWREKFQKARDIVLVGGGSVGFETAGEIKEQFPDKNITIVESQPLLMNETYPAYWRQTLTRKLRDEGVHLVLSDRVEDSSIIDGHVRTKNGMSIAADIVVRCLGPSGPNTSYLEHGFGEESLSEKGFVKVLPTFQVPKHPRVFAAGDIIDWAEEKQAIKAGSHASVVANNVLVILGLAKSMQVYKGSREMIILTDGKNRGAGYFAVLWGITIGDWLSSLLKSRDLALGTTLKSLGLA